MSFEAEIDELQRRGDAVAVARRWLARAVETGDPGAGGAAMRAVAGRDDEDARRVIAEAAVWVGEHHHAREAFAPAAVAFERALEVAVDGVAHIASQLSRARFVLGRHADALAAADRGLAHDAGLARLHVHRGNALNALERYGEAQVEFDAAIAIPAGDVEQWCARAMAHFGRAICISVSVDATAARAELALGTAALEGVAREPEVLRTLGRCHYLMAILELADKRFTEAMSELARGQEALAQIASPPPGVAGEIGRLRVHRSHALVERQHFRAAYVELAGGLRQLEQSIAATGSSAFIELVATQQPLLAELVKVVVQVDAAPRQPSVRCAFCGASPLTSTRRLILGLGDAAICSGCYPRAREDVESITRRDPRTLLRAGAPRYRRGVTCSFCGEGHRRQFIVADAHKICDECLDACADVR